MKHKIKLFIRLGFLIIALFLSISFIRSITKIVGSNQKITDARKKVDELQKENEELIEKLKKVKSVQFIEGQARDKLGLAKKGEIVVVLPDTDTLKSLAPKLPQDKVNLPDPNWKKWLKLFF